MNTNHIKAEAQASITDIPTNLALDAKHRWSTIANARIVEALTQFRIDVEVEAEVPITQLTTNMALALDDVADALGLSNEDRLEVLGDSAYLAIYKDPVPYVPADDTKIEELLAKARATQPVPSSLNIEIRTGAGTKKHPHKWLYALSGRRTPTRMFFRWPDDPPDTTRGTVCLDYEGKTWRLRKPKPPETSNSDEIQATTQP